MCPAICYGIVTGDAPVSYWSPKTFPEVLRELNSVISLSVSKVANDEQQI